MVVVCLILQFWRAVLGLTIKEKSQNCVPPSKDVTREGRCRYQYPMQWYIYLQVRHVSPPKNHHSHAHLCKATTNFTLWRNMDAEDVRCSRVTRANLKGKISSMGDDLLILDRCHIHNFTSLACFTISQSVVVESRHLRNLFPRFSSELRWWGDGYFSYFHLSFLAVCISSKIHIDFSCLTFGLNHASIYSHSRWEPRNESW